MTSRIFAKAFAFSVVATGASALMAEDAPKPELPATAKIEVPAAPAAPTTRPSSDAPAKAQVTEDAQKVIDQVAAAYGKLNSAELSGTMTGDFDAAGQKQNPSDSFSSIYEAPNKFRHASKDEMVIGSTGINVYIYHKPSNIFVQAAAGQEKVAVKDLPRPIPRVIANQNPSLTLAISKDPASELLEDSTSVSRVDDTTIGDNKYPTLKFSHADKTVMTVVFDPATHLIHSSTLDLRAEMEREGIPDVKKALYTVEYTTSLPDAPVKAEQFAWTPPQGAKDGKDLKPLAAAEEASPADALVGKDAPALKLTGLDGKTVTLAELKGKVVVLDFWATWCPPCRQSLPHLDKFYQTNKAGGVQVFAVNVKEEKDKVQDFVDKTKLGVPVLLDSEGKASDAYKAEGIPETVVIGKDGKVIKVIVGFDPDSTPEELAKVAEQANKK